MNDTIGVDIETEAGKIWCVGVADGKERKAFKDTRAALEFVGNRIPIFHNGGYDLSFLQEEGYNPETWHDTILLAHLLGYKPLNLRYLSSVFLGLELDKSLVRDSLKGHSFDENPQESLEMCSLDAFASFALHGMWKDKVSPRFDSLLEMERGITRILMDMKRKGLPVSQGKLQQTRKVVMRKLAESETILLGVGLDPLDKTQFANWFWRGKSPVTTRTGELSTKAKVLRDHMTKSQEVVTKAYIQWKTMDKFRSTYIDAWAHKDWIHADLNHTGTATWRFSCVPLEAEILTIEGWKTYDKLLVGESVLGYNLATGQVQPTRLTAINTGKGQLGEFTWRQDRDTRTGIPCTPNHKWVVENRLVTGLTSANNLLGKHGRDEKVVLAAPAVAGKNPLTPTEAGILGWTITDGHIVQCRSGRALEIQVVKTSSVEALEKLLVGIPHTRSKYDYNHGRKYHWRHRFYIGVEAFEPIIAQVTSWSALPVSLTFESRKAMWDAMMEADGSPRKKTPSFGALKQPALDAFTSLSAVLGIRLTATERPRNGFVDFTINSRRGSLTPKYTHGNQISNVWCPTTEFGTWIVRYRNRVAITGNSSNPNLQNVPKDEDIPLYNLFEAPEGWSFISFDYSQLELRMLANLTGDEAMQRAYLEGRDLHQETQTILENMGIFAQLGVDELHKRVFAKTVNFGIAYGITAWGLSTRLNISEDAAQILIDAFYEAYPRVTAWNNEQYAFAEQHGYAETFLKRPIYVPGMLVDDGPLRHHAEKQTVNAPVQGGATETVKQAMLRAPEYLVFQVHDELLYLCPSNEAEELKRHLEEVLPDYRHDVPYTVEGRIGKTWGDLKNIAELWDEND